MGTTELDPAQFPYNAFLPVKEKRDRYIEAWWRGQSPREVPVLIAPPFDLWNSICGEPERFLRTNLWALANSAEWSSDGYFPHLQPWYGVGIYAAAFGCRYVWLENGAPQTYPIFKSADEVAHIAAPDPSRCEEMKEVLRRIRWYREATHDLLPICLTDTQSPNDTASLLMEVNEFFATCGSELERLEPLLDAVTDLIVRFSEIQMEAIGPNLSLPGHQMLCHPAFRGVSVSDDNIVMLSPRAYEGASLRYLRCLAGKLGGIALHSCGNIEHVLPHLKAMPGLNQIECAVCWITKDTDPNPNRPEVLAEALAGTEIILKARVNKEDIDVLDRLLRPDLKCALAVTGVATREESRVVYDRFKERIYRITSAWTDGGAL